MLDPLLPPEEYQKGITAKKGAQSTLVAGLLSFVIIGGIAKARADYPNLLWWPPEQDTEASAAIVGVVLGAVMAFRNWLKNVKVASVVLCCALALSGCTTTLGAGGLTVTTDASAATAMAPTVLSVSRSIADIMGKLAAERDAREAEELAIKLQAQQQRLDTIMRYVTNATGAGK